MPKAEGDLDMGEVTAAVRQLLAALQFDLNNADMIDTPKRVARMLIAEVTPDEDESILDLLRTFPSDHDAMVTLINHRAFTRCPHHMMPVEMDISIAYIPNGRLIGLSKLIRIADYYSRGWMLQEEIASGIADGLSGALKPLGVAVYIRGRHMCVRGRGVRSTNSEFVTTKVTGLFKEDVKSREEFMSIVQGGYRHG
jgi:GTP cyclohydrolase I